MGSSENDGMHGIEPICEEKKRVKLRPLQKVNGYQPDQYNENQKITCVLQKMSGRMPGLNGPSARDASRASSKPPKEIPHRDISFTCKALASRVHGIET